MSKVVVIGASYETLREDFLRIFELLGTAVITNADKIAIKINLCDYRPPETGATTHPVFLDAFLGYVKSGNPSAKISVVESDASRARPDLIRNWLGITQILDKHGVEWVNLSKGKWVRKKVKGLKFRSIKVPETVLTADTLVSMAKLKTHSLTTISCSLKNIFGCILTPNKIKFHDFLDQAIVDACTLMRPQLSIVDGIIGLGGPKGPVDGIPIHAGLVLAGLDPVAVDAACATTMGLNPHRIGHLRAAERAGLGSLKFTSVPEGTPLPRLDFEINEPYRRILKIASTLARRSISWG
ncbi:MAG: DUF362 domain-containing protein [Candidatus Bathyarchaeia archaeon]